MYFLNGDESTLKARRQQLDAIPVDMTMTSGDWSPDACQTTLAAPFDVTGPATYKKGNSSTLRFDPPRQTQAGKSNGQISRSNFPSMFSQAMSGRRNETSFSVADHHTTTSACPNIISPIDLG